MTALEIFFAAIAAVGTILGGVFIILKSALNNAKNEGKNHERLNNIEKHIENLPCDEHSKQINLLNSLKNTVESTNTMVVNINATVIAISKWICSMDVTMVDKLMGKASPYTITSIGQILLEKSLGKKIIDNNLHFLISEIAKKEPQTNLDIENYSLSVILSNLSSEMFNELKDFVYYQPEQIQITDPVSNEVVDIKISMQILMQLMSIYLRDKYIKDKENKEKVNE
ncbi:MAG: hypothetical protein LBT27_01865 [Prevotellaceae bacterium]|jgi:hypothetical protein|nr:hypothetical protein [Prevotellaceae bacterium]